METSLTNFRILTESQLDYFFANGYLQLPGIVPASLLSRLRELFDELMDISQSAEEKVVHINKGKSYVTNLENICNKGNLSCLELLGSPHILEIAAIICGDDFFLIQEFAVIKWAGDELPVLWHQDMVHQRSGNCFTMGIYLDDAAVDEGALRVVPRSHLDDRSICELSKEPFIEIPMKAGDILIHDMMLAHSSGLLNKNRIRRVIYFEFLSAAHVLKENIYADELINRRTRLLFAATRHYQLLHPDEKEFIHKKINPDPGDAQKGIHLILIEIYKEPIHARPSAYCFENTSTQTGK
jgi:ectoine hydroxylase-related dioxygenase (phytanoyl-CoA dioxygenase family)